MSPSMDLCSQHPSLAVLLFARMAKRSSELLVQSVGSPGVGVQGWGQHWALSFTADQRKIEIIHLHVPAAGIPGFAGPILPRWEQIPAGQGGANAPVWVREGGSSGKEGLGNGKAALGMGMGTVREWEPGELGLAQVCFGFPLTELVK